MKGQSKIEKDKVVLNFINSKWFVGILLIVVLSYYFTMDMVLNLPVWLTITRYFAGFLIVVFIFFLRYRKYNLYYKSLFQNWINKSATIVVILFLATFLQLAINIPLEYGLELASKSNNTENFDCAIYGISKDLKLGDRILFVFRGQLNSRTISKPHANEKELQTNYFVIANVRKSLFGSYYLEHWKLERKN